MKIGNEIPIAKEVKDMTIGDLIELAAKYNMTCVINLRPYTENLEVNEELSEEALKTVNSPCDDCQEFDCYGCEYKEEN